ncbi:MAG: hypothetical protein QFC78_11825 [Pseudomonadota bacterium]|nr:hypothetical protein [Pseudomonadota bacterium]
MRTILVSVAAIALLAGCKGSSPAPAATDSGMVKADPTPLTLPSLAADPKKVPLPGSYSNVSGGTLRLAADMNYTLTGTDGKAATGKYAWYSDGKRILLTEDKSVYAVADGGLYKLESKDSPLTGFTADQLWSKAP